THQKSISMDELARVEDIANRAVLDNTPVVTRLMGIDEAIGTGARALFGEKYSDEVRVGTHVSRTGDIGIITIVSETSVAAGVRRVEAKTATEARRHLNARAHQLHDVAALLRAPEEEADKRLASLIEENRKLERELTGARRKLALGGDSAGNAQPMQEIGGVKFLARVVSGIAMKDLKSLADEAKLSVGSGVVAIVGIGGDGKAGIVVGVTPDLTGRFDAVHLVRPAA